MKLKLKRALLLIKSYIPTKLPVGLTAYMKWSDDVISLIGPIADEDSLRWAISNQVIHLPPQKDRVATQYFIRSLRKAAANQVASQVFQDIKNKQLEAQKAAEIAKQAANEVTPSTTASQGVPSNEQPKA